MMKTSRAVLNERSKNKSTFHKICTYENPSPNFESEEVQRYAYSHIKSPPQQLIFHKEEIRLTPISLPTPPASPEFWGTSLQKWYQKKPLFTLTAKGQVKRIEKYLEIQKTLQVCKREYEIQKQTEDMKKAYADFEFREHQPQLYDDPEEGYVCPCRSSKKNDIQFVPVEYNSCLEINKNFSSHSDDENEGDDEGTERNFDFDMTIPNNSFSSLVHKNANNNDEMFEDKLINKLSPIEEERIIPTKIIKEGSKIPDDRGIHKIIMKNKMYDTSRARYMMKLSNYDRNEEVNRMSHEVNVFHDMPKKRRDRVNSGMSKINVGYMDNLPFDVRKEEYRNTSRWYGNERTCFNCRCHPAYENSSCHPSLKYDINGNEIL